MCWMAIGESSSDTIKTLQHFSLFHLASFCSIVCENFNLSEVSKNWKNAYCNFMLKTHIIFSYNWIFSLIGLIWRGKGFGIFLLPRLLQVLDSWFTFDIEPLKFCDQPLANFHEQANGMSLMSIGCMNDDLVQSENKDQNPNTWKIIVIPLTIWVDSSDCGMLWLKPYVQS
jgi:hypothetical protein